MLKRKRFLLEGEEIDFDLVRKKSVKRNIVVHFADSGRMKVSAPFRSSNKNVHLVLSGMHDQIAELRRKVRKRNLEAPPVAYHHGTRHSYLGQSYPLQVSVDVISPPCVSLIGDYFDIRVKANSEEMLRTVLWRWYRKQAQQYFSQRMQIVAETAPWLSGVPFDLRLRRMKRSWGTCSSSGMITLNPLLMKAEPQYIDYVIAHELCHLREMNHSRNFYSLLASLEPNWKTLRMELNRNSHILLRW